MKKIIIVVLFLVSISYGQDLEKGNISFTFNNEQFDLPITNVVLRKDNDINIRVRAEENIENVAKMISLELSLDRISKDAKEKKVQLDLRHNNRTKQLDENFRILFNAKEEKDQFYYRKRIEGNSYSYEIKNVEFQIDIANTEFTDDKIIIEGTFKGKLETIENKEIPNANATLENGKFRIII